MPAPKSADGWSALTWDDLESWAGVRSVQKGRSYQRGRHVRDLARTADGALLATVQGTRTYATTVSLGGAKKTRLDSECSCPVGAACKHCIAVVAEYLDAVANNRPVPVAPEDDPRWAKLGGDEDGEEWDDGDDGDEDPPRRATVPSLPDVDAKIRASLAEMSHAALADLAWSLIRKSPSVHAEYRERVALRDGDAKPLLAEAKKELRRVTAEVGWGRGWSDEGHTPDYARLRGRLERLLELGRADDVVELGRELIEKGMEQVGRSDDEGETGEQLGSCMPPVFQAVVRSKLPPPQRLLFAIDAILADDWDIVAEEAGRVIDTGGSRADWSAVADALAARLGPAPARREDAYTSKYARERVADWVGRALTNAGRGDELAALYEAEARTTDSYDRLVKFLLDQNRKDDAARWAEAGVAATAEKYPGIAQQLADTLRDLGRARKDWATVAAHAALGFFDRPHAGGYDELVAAADKANVGAAVRVAADRFLETGTKPYTVAATTGRGPAAPPPPPSTAVKPAKRRPEPESPFRVTVAPDWPLPVPDYLLPLLARRDRYPDRTRPHLDVLLDMAIKAKQPERVLHWYDKMRAARSHGGHADRVAEAVRDEFPELALDVYRAGLDAQLPHTGDSAYQQATGYLKKMRPLFEKLGRAAEWVALVASLREKYARRRLFVEMLDTLEGRTIVQAVKKKPK